MRINQCGDNAGPPRAARLCRHASLCGQERIPGYGFGNGEETTRTTQPCRGRGPVPCSRRDAAPLLPDGRAQKADVSDSPSRGVPLARTPYSPSFRTAIRGCNFALELPYLHPCRLFPSIFFLSTGATAGENAICPPLDEGRAVRADGSRAPPRWVRRVIRLESVTGKKNERMMDESERFLT